MSRRSQIIESEKIAEKAVWIALSANLTIMAVKGISGYMSGSTALISETLHSLADSLNSAFLLFGMWSAKKPPDMEHPYGYGKDAYFWSLIAAIFMIGVISTGSIFLGYHKVTSSEEMEDINIAIYGLIISLVLEGVALYYAVRGLRGAHRKNGGIVSAFREADAPLTKLVFIEDSLAFTGVLIALVSVGAVYITGIHAIDGVAAIIIGFVLAALAIMLAKENREKLIGASGGAELEKEIYKSAMNFPPVRDVADLTTMLVGPNKLIAHMTIELDPGTSVEKVDDITRDLERKIIKDVPEVANCYIEVIADEDREPS